MPFVCFTSPMIYMTASSKLMGEMMMDMSDVQEQVAVAVVKEVDKAMPKEMIDTFKTFDSLRNHIETFQELIRKGQDKLSGKAEEDLLRFVRLANGSRI